MGHRLILPFINFNKAIFTKTRGFLLDTLFPIKCFGCGKNEFWLCEPCLNKIPLKIEQVCPICEKSITPGGQTCFACRKKTGLDGLLVATSYQNSVISRMAHYYKYRFIEDLACPLGKILVKSFIDSGLPLPDLIIPVPLHKKRMRWRGFNQSELLARYLCKNLAPGYEIPLEDHALTRKRYTYPQMKIRDYSRRRKNIAGAFGFSLENYASLQKDSQSLKAGTVENKRILLVDDIATTGATLLECAGILKSNRASEVIAIVLARQEITRR